MTQSVVDTIALSEAATKEEELNEAITDIGFVPAAALGVTTAIAAYNAGTTYAIGALVQEAGIVYRSQTAGNIAHTPSADADFANWAPQPTPTYALQNPNFLHAPGFISQRAYATSPPASSAATAAALETISPGPEQTVTVP